jgi:cyclophilin family peptidyl-prolyl cis-trans isomerase
MPVSKKRKNKKQQDINVPKTATEFDGFMGWLQNKQKWFYITGTFVLILSLGSAILFSFIPEPVPVLPEKTVLESESNNEKAEKIISDSAASEKKIDNIIRRYDVAPEMIIDINKKYSAVIETVKGNIVLDLFAKESPLYVNNFVFLSNNKFYDGLTFHRVIKDFVVQGGDPTGTGEGGPGYKMTSIIAYAQSSAGVHGSQFFIALSNVQRLKQSGFSAFGKIIEGTDVLQSIRLRDPNNQPRSAPADRIITISIIEK